MHFDILSQSKDAIKFERAQIRFHSRRRRPLLKVPYGKGTTRNGIFSFGRTKKGPAVFFALFSRGL